MQTLLGAKLGFLLFAGAAFSGCIEDNGWDDERYKDHEYGNYRGSAEVHATVSIEDEYEEVDCSARPEALDLAESRDVAGYSSKHWDWSIESCQVEKFTVDFAVSGINDLERAASVCFRVELMNAEGEVVAEVYDVAVLSESQTVLHYEIGANDTLQPGDWMLMFHGQGAFHYDVGVHVDY